MGATISDCIMAFSGATGPVGSDAADLLVRRDRVERIRQHRRIADVASGDLDSPNLKRFLIDSELDLAADPPLGTTMLAGVPPV